MNVGDLRLWTKGLLGCAVVWAIFFYIILH